MGITLTDLDCIDYEQPLFFRSPSSVKRKKRARETPYGL